MASAKVFWFFSGFFTAAAIHLSAKWLFKKKKPADQAVGETNPEQEAAQAATAPPADQAVGGTNPEPGAAPTATAPPDGESQSEIDYEVFLSFRGKDTRSDFTDFLYNDLVDQGVRTFRDDDELHIGEEIGPELLKAIENSRIFISIFSKDYASSKWCLTELSHAVKCRKRTKQKIFPIFYEVTPDDLKLKSGNYEKAFREHGAHFSEEVVEEWKKALREVKNLKGLVVERFVEGHRGKQIKSVVSAVLNKLQKAYGDYVVGIDQHVDKLMKFLDTSDDVRIVGIHGMGGIGKTTLAKFLYHKLSNRFQCHSFLADIRETCCSQSKGLEDLQKRLLSDILRQKFGDIADATEGIEMIGDRFPTKNVLILLDDVDQTHQLKALAGKRDWFGPRSRIIITTRNKNILESPEVDLSYELKELDAAQSLKLFSKHAFRREHPPPDYYRLSEDIVVTAAGLPLALEVIGAYLRGKNETVWRDTSRKLQKIPNSQVQEKLKISYEALDNEQKDIFLDIACLFVRIDKSIPMYMWDDCGLFPESALEVLNLMSLIKIQDDNKITMHDQLRDLGREIVRLEDIKQPGKRSRLWSHTEALDVLRRRRVTKNVEALCVDFRRDSEGNRLTNEEFKELTNLRFLKINQANLCGDFDHILSGIRWLHWNRCPPHCMAKSLNLDKLVILDLTWSKVSENWEGWNHIKILTGLKVLNLTACLHLTRIPDLSTHTKLERLILEDCENLNHIDPSISNLNSLVLLNMRDCTKLSILPQEMGSLGALEEYLIDGTSVREIPVSKSMKRLKIISATCNGSLSNIPSSIGDLKSMSDLRLDFTNITELPDLIGLLVNLQCLSLRYCGSLERLPESIGNLESLTELRLFSVKLTELPDAVGNLKALKVLDVDFSQIRRLPSTIGMLENLEEIHASHCYNLAGDIPEGVGNLMQLRILRLELSDICSIPVSIGKLNQLKILDLHNCKKLESLPALPSHLVSLKLTCLSMETFLDLPNMVKLKDLCLSNCSKLVEIPSDIGKLVKLGSLTLYQAGIGTLPTQIGALGLLKELILQGCENLKSLPVLPPSLSKLWIEVCNSLGVLPELSNLENLSDLTLRGCPELAEIRGLGRLKFLLTLDLAECDKLQKLGDLERLKFLKYLNVSRCEALEQLPDLSNLTRLRKLVALGCRRIVEVEGLDCLESLEYLNMSGCISLERLPDLSKLSMLKEVDFSWCEKLCEIEGLQELKSLKWLDISRCKSIERLPDLSSLTNLKRLSIESCEKLTDIPGLGKLKSLECLNISGCKELNSLPDLSNIRKIKF